MLRAFIKTDLQRAAESAVGAARVAVVGASGGASGLGGVPAIPLTTEGFDADGNVIEVHDFFLGLDTLGDASAILRSSGKVINYGPN
ncbi:MAG TPA: hypothetical protein VF719_10515 [Abditibacteriaceae bacterium]|jgi:hypothetical protein